MKQVYIVGLLNGIPAVYGGQLLGQSGTYLLRIVPFSKRDRCFPFREDLRFEADHPVIHLAHFGVLVPSPSGNSTLEVTPPRLSELDPTEDRIRPISVQHLPGELFNQSEIFPFPTEGFLFGLGTRLLSTGFSSPYLDKDAHLEIGASLSRYRARHPECAFFELVSRNREFTSYDYVEKIWMLRPGEPLPETL